MYHVRDRAAARIADSLAGHTGEIDRIGGIAAARIAETLSAHTAEFDQISTAAAAMITFVRLYEEPTLEETYGEEYRSYKKNVRAWIPRLTPWR